jgi:hypothetical protein
MIVSVDQVDVMNFFAKDPQLPKIAFTLKGYTIAGGDREKGYRRLERLVWDNRIKVNRRASDAGFGDAAGAASYFMGNDNFSLGSRFKVGGVYGQALLAHEGAHALIDLQNRGAVDRGVSEAIGYLAEAMWLDLSGYAAITDKGGKANPVRVAAMALAQRTLATSSSQVPDADADRLAALIRQNGQYDDPNPHISDGIG